MRLVWPSVAVGETKIRVETELMAVEVAGADSIK
jgi:hypothetical protein